MKLIESITCNITDEHALVLSKYQDEDKNPFVQFQILHLQNGTWCPTSTIFNLSEGKALLFAQTLTKFLNNNSDPQERCCSICGKTESKIYDEFNECGRRMMWGFPEDPRKALEINLETKELECAECAWAKEEQEYET